MLVYVWPSNEALLRARVPGAQDQRGCPSNSFHLSSSTFFLNPERKASRQAGSQVAPPLRVSEKGLCCHSSKGAAGLFFTARIEGPPFHRGASASSEERFSIFL